MSTAAENARFATYVVDALAAAGLTEVVPCPGSRHTPLVLALDACAQVRCHTVLDERAGAFVALGLARAGGRAAAICCTSGSAGANCWPAVVEASQAGIPLLVLTADRPRELQACGAPQTIDQTRLFGTYVRWFFDMGRPRDDSDARWIDAIAAQAWMRLHGPDGGPVHLNLPFDEPLWEPQTPVATPRDTTVPTVLRGVTRLDDAQLDTLARRVQASERGVVVCGPTNPSSLRAVPLPGPSSSGQPLGELDGPIQALNAGVARLAGALGWPLIAEPASQLRFRAERAPGLIAHGDALLRSTQARAAFTPDLVLRLGGAPTSNAINGWLKSQAAGRCILIDPSSRYSDPGHDLEMLVAADPVHVCHALADRLTPTGDARSATRDNRSTPDSDVSAWLSRWSRADATAGEVLGAVLSEDDPLWEGLVARTLVQQLPAGAVLHVASSMPIRDLDSFGGHVPRDLIVTANRGANGIDGTVATAGGQALGLTDRPAALLCGDLALFHDMGGLAAAAQLGARLTVVALDNGGGGIFSFLPIAAHPTAFEKRFLTPQGTRIAELCAAVGADYRPARCTAELVAALDDLSAPAGLVVVHVPIDRQTNVERHEQAMRAVERALQGCGKDW